MHSDSGVGAQLLELGLHGKTAIWENLDRGLQFLCHQSEEFPVCSDNLGRSNAGLLIKDFF